MQVRKLMSEAGKEFILQKDPAPAGKAKPTGYGLGDYRPFDRPNGQGGRSGGRGRSRSMPDPLQLAAEAAAARAALTQPLKLLAPIRGLAAFANVPVKEREESTDVLLPQRERVYDGPGGGGGGNNTAAGMATASDGGGQAMVIKQEDQHIQHQQGREVRLLLYNPLATSIGCLTQVGS